MPNLCLNTWRMNLSPKGLPVGLWTYCLSHYPLPPHPTKPQTIPPPRHGWAGWLPLATPRSYHISTLKRGLHKVVRHGSVPLAHRATVSFMCVCNANRWIRQQGSVGNGEWRQNRTEQSRALLMTCSPRCESQYVCCVCLHVWWGIMGSVSTHIYNTLTDN